MPIYNVIIRYHTVAEILVEASSAKEARRFTREDMNETPKEEVNGSSCKAFKVKNKSELTGKYITRTDNSYYRYPKDKP